VSDLSDLLVALAALIPALGSTFVLIWSTIRTTRKPDQVDEVARSAAETTAAAIVEALADGELSADEADGIVAALRGDNPHDPDHRAGRGRGRRRRGGAR
jgi:hypothetical protein